jgi:RNA recognition motif-containing protein
MTKIYVGNLGVSATEDMLRPLFEKYGTVERVDIVTDRHTGRPRDFGFVEMSDYADAVKAMAALNGWELDGRPIHVNEARPKTNRPRGDLPSGGGSGRKRC